jgi:hypothetical protein
MTIQHRVTPLASAECRQIAERKMAEAACDSQGWQKRSGGTAEAWLVLAKGVEWERRN